MEPLQRVVPVADGVVALALCQVLPERMVERMDVMRAPEAKIAAAVTGVIVVGGMYQLGLYGLMFTLLGVGSAAFSAYLTKTGNVKAGAIDVKIDGKRFSGSDALGYAAFAGFLFVLGIVAAVLT